MRSGGRVSPLSFTDQTVDTVAIRAINRKIHDDNRVEASMVPIGDGLTLALKL